MNSSKQKSGKKLSWNTSLTLEHKKISGSRAVGGGFPQLHKGMEWGKKKAQPLFG